jgi:DNA-binding transcriptional LysR family regulator
MVAGCTITPLFEALAAFRHAHPGVEVSLVEDESDRLVEHVRTGAADLALAGIGATPPAGLESLTIVSEPIVTAVPAGHPLAGRPRLALADLAPHQVICLPEGTGIRSVFDRACAAAGIRPDVSLQASAPDAVADLARRGLGVAVLSASMVAGDDGLVARSIDDAPEPAVLALLWRPTQTPALRALLDHARAAFAGAPGPSPAPR